MFILLQFNILFASFFAELLARRDNFTQFIVKLLKLSSICIILYIFYTNSINYGVSGDARALAELIEYLSMQENCDLGSCIFFYGEKYFGATEFLRGYIALSSFLFIISVSIYCHLSGVSIASLVLGFVPLLLVLPFGFYKQSFAFSVFVLFLCMREKNLFWTLLFFTVSIFLHYSIIVMWLVFIIHRFIPKNQIFFVGLAFSLFIFFASSYYSLGKYFFEEFEVTSILRPSLSAALLIFSMFFTLGDRACSSRDIIFAERAAWFYLGMFFGTCATGGWLVIDRLNYFFLLFIITLCVKKLSFSSLRNRILFVSLSGSIGFSYTLLWVFYGSSASWLLLYRLAFGL